MKRSPLAILFLTVLLDLVGFGIVLPLLPTYAKDLGASPFMIGLITAIYSFMQFIFAPLWGKLSDHIGRRPVMLTSIFMASVSYLFFAHATTVFLLVLSRGLSGIGSANIAAAQAYITDVTDSKNRSRAMGILGAAFGLGFVIGPLLGGTLKTNFGIEMVGYVASGLIGINFILAFFFLLETNRDATTIRQAFNALTDSSKRPQLHSLQEKAIIYFNGVREAVGNPPVALLMSSNFIYTLGIVNMQIAAILLWKEYFNATEQQTGYLFAYVGIVTALVQAGLLGKLNKKFKERPLYLWGNAVTFIGVFFIPFIPSTSLFSLGLVILLFYALGTSLVYPINISMLSLYSYKQKQGQILGYNQSINALARILGPFSGSILYGIYPQIPFIVAGVLTVIGTIISLGLFRYNIDALDRQTEQPGESPDG